MWSSDRWTQGLEDKLRYGLVGGSFCDNRAAGVSIHSTAIVQSQTTHRSMMHIMGATRTLEVAADTASNADRRARLWVFHFLLLTSSRSGDPRFESKSASCVICICLAIASGWFVFWPSLLSSPNLPVKEGRGHFALKSAVVGDERCARGGDFKIQVAILCGREVFCYRCDVQKTQVEIIRRGSVSRVLTEKLQLGSHKLCRKLGLSQPGPTSAIAPALPGHQTAK